MLHGLEILMKAKFEAYTYLVLGFGHPGVSGSICVVGSSWPVPGLACFKLIPPGLVPSDGFWTWRVKHKDLVYAWEDSRGCRLWPLLILRTSWAMDSSCTLRSRCCWSCWRSCSCTGPSGISSSSSFVS